MVRSDILTGLRNAIERGSSMEAAKQTLRNSGYNIHDVNEAANYLTSGLGDREFHQNKNQEFKKLPNQNIQSTDKERMKQDSIENNKMPKSPQEYSYKHQPPSLYAGRQGAVIGEENLKESNNIGILIFLILVLLILVGGLIAAIIFRESLITFFQNLFG